MKIDAIFNFFLFHLFLLFIGVFGLFATRRNMIIVLVCIELILLVGTLNFVLFSAYLDDLVGQIFSFFILTIAASELAIGLALLVLHYRHIAVISVDAIS
jgi:NADH-quinone oxidoreductase subunit K